MKNKYVHTKIGLIDITNNIDGFVCDGDVGVELGEKIIIKSCLSRVVGTDKDGNKTEVSPVLVESCMNPEIKTIIPIEIAITNFNGGEKSEVTAKNKYMKVEFGDEYEKIEVQKYRPYGEGYKCSECNNCGRC